MPRRSWRAADLPVAVRAGALAALAALTLVTFTEATATQPRRADILPGGESPALVPLPPPVEAAPVLDAALRGRWEKAWAGLAQSGIDRETLGAAGVVVPDGANVFAARIVEGGPSPAYMLYEAGGGAFSSGFYPASSIKVLAAVGALERAHASGFTGEAVVDGGYSLASYYDAAIRHSSNEDYDELVRIAGVEWLNEDFLPGWGYASTHIQQPYADGGVVGDAPPIHLAEGELEAVFPERHVEQAYGCEGANCSTLFELVDSVRRVMLHAELPPEERFRLTPGDVAGLQDALLGAESWIGAGVAEALGPDAEVYSKPGWTAGRDCVDVALVVDGKPRTRYLLGVSSPDDGECAVLAAMAAQILTVLATRDDGQALRTDGTSVAVIDGRPAGG